MIVVVLFSLITMLFVFLSNNFHAAGEENKEYVLKSRGDFLALYYGEEIIEIYDNIVISSLPVFDREQFLRGIRVKDIKDIPEILEDFE